MCEHCEGGGLGLVRPNLCPQIEYVGGDVPFRAYTLLKTFVADGEGRPCIVNLKARRDGGEAFKGVELELRGEPMPINYCPMCGRELRGGAE